MQTKQWIHLIVCFLLLLSLGTLFAVRHAAAQGTQAGGIVIDNALLELGIGPGQAWEHTMTISLGPQAGETRELAVEALGFAQKPDGGYQTVPAEKDTSPNSARPFVTAIDVPRFRLAPGQSQVVKATVTMPAQLQPFTYYGCLFVHTVGEAATQYEFIVPIVVTPRGLQPVHTGQITDLKVNEVKSGQPLEVVTTFQNTGNQHYKAQNKVTIKNAQGQVVATIAAPLSSSSIVPGFARQWVAQQSLMGGGKGLEPGNYVAESVVSSADGELLGSRQAPFVISTPYTPFADVDPNSVVIVSFVNQTPTRIDAWDKARIQLDFANTGPVTGTVAVAAYPRGFVPRDAEALIKPRGEGGHGMQAVRYLAMRVEGFDQGTAHVTVGYNQNELGSLNANSLLLTFFASDRWSNLDKLQVYSGAGKVEGDLSVAALARGSLGALASDSGAATGGLPLVPILGIGGGAVVVALFAVLIIQRRRPRSMVPARR